MRCLEGFRLGFGALLIEVMADASGVVSVLLLQLDCDISSRPNIVDVNEGDSAGLRRKAVKQEAACWEAQTPLPSEWDEMVSCRRLVTRNGRRQNNLCRGRVT